MRTVIRSCRSHERSRRSLLRRAEPTSRSAMSKPTVKVLEMWLTTKGIHTTLVVVVVGCWLLVVGCWLLVVGCWLLVVGCWLLVVGCWLLVVGCWLLVVGCWLLVVGCWLLVVGCEDAMSVCMSTAPQLLIGRASTPKRRPKKVVKNTAKIHAIITGASHVKLEKIVQWSKCELRGAKLQPEASTGHSSPFKPNGEETQSGFESAAT